MSRVQEIIKKATEDKRRLDLAAQAERLIAHRDELRARLPSDTRGQLDQGVSAAGGSAGATAPQGGQMSPSPSPKCYNGHAQTTLDCGY